MANILITGGSRGIGEACVRAFCAQGDRVAFFYRSSHEAAKKLADETGAVALCVDVTDSDAVQNGITASIDAFGSIDALICNVGIAQIKLFTDLTDEDWRQMMRVNLDGAFYTARTAAKHMIANQKGSIVFVGSMWGKTGASCEVHYSASKAALRGMTMALAKELGPSHIRVNCVEPGVIDTEMNASLDEGTRNELCDATPLCRIGSPLEVADAILFLSSQKASFVTGQILGVDGGFAV